ncbi:hypothetical protein [Bdellovibrio sp. HCB337]|uniref:hypothetical protein n=1 Tax=Bdellovibrio sp. HCB337 TaxID=3394358 RepID=UPI0039A6A7D1
MKLTILFAAFLFFSMGQGASARDMETVEACASTINEYTEPLHIENPVSLYKTLDGTIYRNLETLKSNFKGKKEGSYYTQYIVDKTNESRLREILNIKGREHFIALDAAKNMPYIEVGIGRVNQPILTLSEAPKAKASIELGMKCEIMDNGQREAHLAGCTGENNVKTDCQIYAELEKFLIKKKELKARTVEKRPGVLENAYKDLKNVFGGSR